MGNEQMVALPWGLLLPDVNWPWWAIVIWAIVGAGVAIPVLRRIWVYARSATLVDAEYAKTTAAFAGQLRNAGLSARERRNLLQDLGSLNQQHTSNRPRWSWPLRKAGAATPGTTQTPKHVP